jgi:hypothetical protein
MKVVSLEIRSLKSPLQCLCVTGLLLATLAALRAFNQHQAKSAAIHFEELPVEVITTLNLSVK